MDIGIINIGDELLGGKRLNTNQFDLSGMLAPLGHRVRFTLVLGDSMEDLQAALQAVHGAGSAFSGGLSVRERTGTALPKVEVLVLTGGLGPTRDDLTRQAVADFLGAGLEENREAKTWLAEFLGKSSEELPDGQAIQACIPAGSEPLRNPAGTACGFRFSRGGVVAYAFPGVPRELAAMASLHLLPTLSDGKVLLERALWTWGWSEGAQKVAFQELAFPEGMSFSSLPGEKGVRISLSLLCQADERLRQEAELQKAWDSLVRAIPREALVHAGGKSLPAAVFELLKRRGETLAIAESCTGGALGFALTEVPGSSAIFHQGFLTYSNQAKEDLLKVPKDLLATHGAVSQETAIAMALGCLERSNATYACAITGIAGPDGGTEEKPVGTVWIALASAQRTQARHFLLRGDRQAIRQRSTYWALNLVRLFILEDET